MSSIWSKVQFEAERRLLVEQLRSEFDGQPNEKRLQRVLGLADEFKKDESSLGQLRCFIACSLALYHQGHHGGLTEVQIRSLMELAQAILRVHGVEPNSRRLKYFHSELNMIYAQIKRRAGQHWEAAWMFSQVGTHGNVSSTGETGFILLGLANRAVRLGYVDLARQRYLEALAEGLSEPNQLIARIGLIKIYRWTSDFDAAEKLSKETVETLPLSDLDKMDLKWEELLRRRMVSGNLDDFIPIFDIKKHVFHALFILESLLFIKSSPKLIDTAQLPKVSTTMRRNELDIDNFRDLFRAVQVIMDCYDSDIAIEIRLEKLFKTLGSASELITFEQEMLLFLAASRWLARSNLHDLACLALNRYKIMSIQISSGKNPDVLGFGKDLFEKPWFF